MDFPYHRVQASAAVVLVAALLLVISPKSVLGRAEGYSSQNVSAAMQYNEGYSSYMTAMEANHLNTEIMNNGQPMTLFAPTNEAFDALPEETKAMLNTDSPAARYVLGSHIALGYYSMADLQGMDSDVQTLTGPVMHVTYSERNGWVELKAAGEEEAQCKVAMANVVANEQIAVHGIDAVLVPNPV